MNENELHIDSCQNPKYICKNFKDMRYMEVDYILILVRSKNVYVIILKICNKRR